MDRLGTGSCSFNCFDELNYVGHTFLKSKSVWSRMDARAANDPEGATPCDPMSVDRSVIRWRRSDVKVEIENKQTCRTAGGRR